MFSDFLFLWNFSVYKCVCYTSVCVHCAFLASFFYLFVLTYSDLFIKILVYSILFITILYVWFLMRERNIVCGFEWVGRREDLEEAGWGETVMRRYCMKNVFSVKNYNFKQSKHVFWFIFCSYDKISKNQWLMKNTSLIGFIFLAWNVQEYEPSIFLGLRYSLILYHKMIEKQKDIWAYRWDLKY